MLCGFALGLDGLAGGFALCLGFGLTAGFMLTCLIGYHELQIISVPAQGLPTVRLGDPKQLEVGDPVMALVSSGGYAEYCLAPAPQVLPIPSGLTMTEAASRLGYSQPVQLSLIESGKRMPLQSLAK